MTEKNKYIAVIGILVTIIIILIISNNNTAKLFEQAQQDFNAQMSTLQQRINNLSSQINGIQSSVLNQLKKESSIISDYRIEQGTYNKQTFKVDVNLFVTPKSYKENTVAYIVLNDTTRYQMNNNNGVFSAELSLTPNADYSVTFNFENDGTHTSEKVDDTIRLSNYFYEISKSYMDIRRTEFSDGVLKLIEVEAHIGIKPLGGKISSARFYALVNGSQVWSENITSMFSKSYDYYSTQLAITKSIKAEDNANVELLAEVIDEEGFIYTILFLSEKVFADKSFIPSIQGDGLLKSIKAPDGTIIK